jgi:hypothetical protein
MDLRNIAVYKKRSPYKFVEDKEKILKSFYHFKDLFREKLLNAQDKG